MLHSTAIVALAFAPSGLGEPAPDIGFETRRLSSEFFCEGASFGDFNQDGLVGFSDFLMLAANFGRKA